jgi:hypothetical protein
VPIGVSLVTRYVVALYAMAGVDWYAAQCSAVGHPGGRNYRRSAENGGRRRAVARNDAAAHRLRDALRGALRLVPLQLCTRAVRSVVGGAIQ